MILLVHRFTSTSLPMLQLARIFSSEYSQEIMQLPLTVCSWASVVRTTFMCSRPSTGHRLTSSTPPITLRVWHGGVFGNPVELYSSTPPPMVLLGLISSPQQTTHSHFHLTRWAPQSSAVTSVPTR